MSTPDERLRRTRVAELKDLTGQQRADLREVALRSPREAEEWLGVVLRRSNESFNRAYVREVLLAGGDHASWTACHAQWPDPWQEITQMVGRPLRPPELQHVDDIAQLTAEQISFARDLCAAAVTVAVAKYLRLVAAEPRTSVRLRYLENVVRGGLSHDEWVRDVLPGVIKGSAWMREGA